MLLSNSLISISVSELGAEIVSLKKDDHEYIWTGDKSFWARHAPILFPIVGKVYNNEYIYDNQLFKLNQHGFARDSKFEMIDDNTLRLSSVFITLLSIGKILPISVCKNLGKVYICSIKKSRKGVYLQY